MTAVRPRARITERLRDQLARRSPAATGRSSDVAAEYGVSWPTAHKALVAAAARWLPEPAPTSRLGIDETRFRSVRWILDGITWKRSNPWLTSFVDCSLDGPGSLLGLAPGRSGGCVRDWLGEQTEAVPGRGRDRDHRPVGAVRVGDPGRAAARETGGRQMASGRARQRHGHRGPAADHPRPARPPRPQRRPGLGEPQTAADRRRAPVDQAMAPPHHHARRARSDRGDRRRLGRQGTPPDAARRTRTSRRSGGGWPTSTTPRSTPECPKRPGSPSTIQTWWPAILVALTEHVTNARTEGFNRIIKQVKRAGCGYRNMINYQRRILTHIAVTRPQRSAA